MTSASQDPRRMLMVTTVHHTLRAFLLPFADHLRAGGWQVDAATAADPDIVVLDEHFDRVWAMPWSRSIADVGNVRGFTAMRGLLQRGHYDIVHVHTPIASLVTRLAAASLGRRRPAIVYTAHGFHFFEGGNPKRNVAYKAAERLGGRWTDREIVINTEDFAAARDLRIVPLDRLRLFPGIGVDLDHYTPTPQMRAEGEQLRADHGIPANATVYSMVAEFQPRKDHRTAVAAFAQLPDRDSHLMLAGLGILEDAVRQQVAELELEDRVHFLGLVEDVRPLMLTSAATLLPSHQEGLSRAVMESLAIGVPVVGGRTRGIRDLVDDDLGILVDVADVPGLARALTDVLAFPTGGDLRARSLERMEQYSIDRVVELHDELYADLLAERARTRR